MRLPPLLVLTDRSQCVAPLRDTVATAVDRGARAVVLREKDLPAADRAGLAAELGALLEPVGGVLVLAGTRGDAVHLSAQDAFPEPRPSLVGRSCHSEEEVARARGEGCDYVTVSPVFPTSSKPGYGPVLGLDGLALLTGLGPPVYALGGIQPSDARACIEAGARGVAVMGPIMREPEIVAAYLELLAGVGT
ncbi:MAG: thiamine phosphate synthase [Actinomycetota bacterium]|nr:thiamine phosphate synthase [Actinomycetota bacterium]